MESRGVKGQTLSTAATYYIRPKFTCAGSTGVGAADILDENPGDSSHAGLAC